MSTFNLLMMVREPSGLLETAHYCRHSALSTNCFIPLAGWWDAMRSGRPSLPVAKTLAKAWNTPGVHLGRSATIRLLTAGRDAGLAEALSYFGGLDYLRPRANEWTGLFASGLFSQDVSKQFWVGFVQEVMHLNALELHSDLGRLRQWDGTNTFGTDVRFRPEAAPRLGYQ